MQVIYDEAKLTELILHLACRLAGDRDGGAIKLDKALYFGEFAHVRRHGRPISGVTFFKRPDGPAPRRLKPVRSALIERGDAELVREDFLGYEMQRLVARREPDLTVFDHDELETIDRVLSDLAGLTGMQVSRLSREDAAWRLTADNDDIPYELALVPKDQRVTPTAMRLGREAAERYGIAIP